MSPTKPHIYFYSTLDSADEWRDALATEFADFTFSVGDEVDAPETVDVAIVWTLPDPGLERFANLRAILSLGAGINQLDPKRLPAKVPLARLVDASLTRMMVDYAKLAVYRYHRKFHLFEQRSRERRWIYDPPTLTNTTTVGILGLGELGGEMASMLRAEGFDVHGWSRSPKTLEGIQTYMGRDGLVSMVGRCDIVINVLPLTEATRHILSRELFDHFKDSACLINMGRGRHLVDADLLAAIDAGKIAAATLDVFSIEPLPDAHPFWNHPKILVTPHVAGTSVPTSAVAAIAANIRRAIAGERLLQQVDTSRGY
jgi:glyoxylate/hydroxypyruvate reductase A